MDKKILGLIPARGGSKRVPGKNIRPIAGKPLLAWTIEAASKSNVFDRLVVSTDDNDIAEVARQYGVEVIRRPAALATDTATTFDAVIHALDVLHADGYDLNAVALLQPTSPLRTPSDISGAIALWHVHQDATVFGVCELGNPAAAWSFMIKDERLVPLLGWEVLVKRSQDVPTLYIPNGALCIFAPEVVRRHGKILGPPLIPYTMPSERSIDIDTLEDFETAERLMLQGAASSSAL